MEQQLKKPEPPKLFNSKCTGCGTEILYPWHMCNDCVKQGVMFSGMEAPKKVKAKKVEKKQ